MFKFDSTLTYDISGYSDKEHPLKKLARSTSNIEEITELLKIENPFINREIAKNPNLSEDLMFEMLLNHIAYTMCINIAKNPNITQDIKLRLYEIAEDEYCDSSLRYDLNDIFKS